MVFNAFSQFGSAGGADRHELVNDLAVERHADVKAGGCATADDFGDRVGGEVGIARILALRRVDKIDVFTECEARSEEHTSELQSLMRNSYAIFCLKKKNKHIIIKQRQRT